MAEFLEDATPGRGAAAQPPPRIGAREQRVALQRRVREIRARLLQGPGVKPEFEYELLCLFARSEVSARTTVPLLAVVLASTLWAPPVQAGAWVAMVLAMKLFMVAACLDFLSRPRSEVRVARWRRRLLWLDLATGATWGGIAALGLGAADAAGHVFLLASLIALLAIRIFASGGRLGLQRRHHRSADAGRGGAPGGRGRAPPPGHGRDRRRPARLLPLPGARAQRHGARHARMPGREGCADRRERGRTGHLRRGAAARRGGERRQVAASWRP